MSDRMSALSSLNAIDCKERTQALQHFYERGLQDPLMVNKWLGLEASSPIDGTLNRVKALAEQAPFDINNPNKVYALLTTFGDNPKHFHTPDGSAYEWLKEKILLIDAQNPQVSARVFQPFSRWKQYREPYATLMKKAVIDISQAKNLSRDLHEIVEKTLLA